eukprot:jgi/Ulvmu1/12398/UM009_0045.1
MFSVKIVDACAGRGRVGQRATKPSRVLGRDYLARVQLHDITPRRLAVVASALLPVPGLDARKLSISYMSTGAADVKFLREGQPRRYTLTHNDLTAQLHLAVGDDFNTSQISGWYSRLVRDEVCAEWCFSGGPALHLHCHVSGAVSWFAPARFRSYIFSREMPLVLDSIVFAERHLFTCRLLRQAPVFVHFEAVESDLARVEYWGTLGEWIERADGPAEEHLAKVSRTVRDAQPAIPRYARLDGPLEGLLELLTNSLVERPRPGGGVEAARSVLQDRSGGDSSGGCAVCGEGRSYSGSAAAAAAAPRAARAAQPPECDCAACTEAAAEAQQAATAAAAPARQSGELAGGRLRASTDDGAGLCETKVPPARAGGTVPPGRRGMFPTRNSRVPAVPAALSDVRESVHAWRDPVHASSSDAVSTIDLLDDDHSSIPASGPGILRRVPVATGRTTTILSLERAVSAAPGAAPGSAPAQRRRTLSHYVAPTSTPPSVQVRPEGLPALPGQHLPVGAPLPAAATPSLHAELARRSRAAASELRREGSRSRTPDRGRRRVSV